MSEERIAITTDLILRHWWTDYLHPSMWHALALIIVLIAVRFRQINAVVLASIVLLSLGCIGFLLLFFEKFADHDYYALHMMPLVGLLLIGGSQALAALQSALIKTGLVIGIWILAIASMSLSYHDLQRRSQTAPDSFSQTGALLIHYDESRQSLPADARVVILGDHTPNGALSRIGRQGWSFPGYPMHRLPDIKDLMQKGATHILVLRPERVPEVPLRQIEDSGDYSLWEITR